MMIEAKIDPDIWSQIVTTVEAVASEISFNFESGGINVEQISTDKSNQVSINLPVAEFISYAITENQAVRLGMEKLTNLNKRLAGVQMISILREEKSNMLDLILIGEKQTRKFSIPIIAETGTESENMRRMDDYGVMREFTAEFQISPTLFENVVKDIQLVSKFVKIQVESDKLIFSTTEGDGEVKIEIENGGEELYNLAKSGDSILTSRFLTTRFVDFKDAIKQGDPIVKIGHRKPMLISLPLGNTGSARMLIAPIDDRSK